METNVTEGLYEMSVFEKRVPTTLFGIQIYRLKCMQGLNISDTHEKVNPITSKIEIQMMIGSSFLDQTFLLTINNRHTMHTIRH